MSVWWEGFIAGAAVMGIVMTIIDVLRTKDRE